MCAQAAKAGKPRFRRVLVLTGDHGQPDPTKWGSGYSADDLKLHREMREALESLSGYDFEFLTDHGRLLERLLGDEPPELILNFCDTGYRNVPTLELNLPALFELLEIPYSGAPPASIALCYDKAVVRAVADAHDIPTPWEIYLAPGRPLEDAEASYPALIKPAQGDGSVGITRDAVVESPQEARQYLARLRRELPGRAVLLQEYLSGTEYGLALMGNPGDGLEALPAMQVDYSDLDPGLPRILAFESKTGPATTPYAAVRIVPAQLDEKTLGRLRSWSELLFARFQCRDYARFDFRTGADGVIKLMEVNPNPAWATDGKLAMMAAFEGTSYPRLMERILEVAQRRCVASGCAE